VRFTVRNARLYAMWVDTERRNAPASVTLFRT